MRNHPDPQLKTVNTVNKSHFLSKTFCCLRNLWNKFGDPGNDQLVTLRYDFKRLTTLTSIPNIALNEVRLCSSWVLFNKSTFTARIMTF